MSSEPVYDKTLAELAAQARVSSALNSATGIVAITPNDSTDLARPVRALWIGVGGDIKIQSYTGTAEVLKNVESGQLLPVQAVRVYAVGTTATDIKGLY